jgi:hypothetical protein
MWLQESFLKKEPSGITLRLQKIKLHNGCRDPNRHIGKLLQKESKLVISRLSRKTQTMKNPRTMRRTKNQTRVISLNY